MCPGGPYAVHHVCGAPEKFDNTSYFKKGGAHREASASSSGAPALNGTRERKRVMRDQHPGTGGTERKASAGNKPVREKLLELDQIRDEKLVSQGEYESLRKRILDAFVTRTAQTTSTK